MSMTINTNISSLSAQRYLTKTQSSLSTSMERLSSGLRINSAKDDAAGLGISTRLSAKVSGMDQAVRNANDGISLLQTAEGASQEVTSILQRMRVLAVQSANGTYDTTTDRASMNSEVTQLKSEIDRIVTSTKFNGIGLMDNSSTLTFQVGSDQGQTITATMSKLDTTTLTVAAGSVSTATDAGALISSIDTALNTVSTARGNTGAVQNRLSSTISNLMNISENMTAANGRILDADFAAETANLAKQQILSQAGTAMLGQAKQLPQQVLELLK
jgi:flagellin